MAWIAAHYKILSLLINGLMLVVWVFYAHLLLNNYRRQRKPKLLINQSLGRSLDARCLICNMSEESLYVAMVIAELTTPDDRWECEVTDIVPLSDELDAKPTTTQGPLKAGEYRDQETFRYLIDRILNAHGKQDLARCPDLELCNLSIHVVALYGAEDLPVGASRTFAVVSDDEVWLKPHSVETDALNSPKDRKQVRKWLEKYL